MNSRFLRFTAIAALILSLGAAQAHAQLGIKFAGSVQKKDGPMQVTVAFSEPIDPATGGDKGNYNLGAGVTINNAQMVTGLPGLNDPGNGDPPLRGRVISNQAVILEVTGLGTADVTLTVNGVQNAAKTETLSNATLKFTPSGYSWCDVAKIYTSSADPGWVAPGRKAGIVLADSNNGFDIYNNGRTGWAGEDEFTFVYKEVTGDFDFKSRIEFQDSPSRWSRAGIQVREALDDGAAEGCMHRYVTAHADPPTAFSDTAAAVVPGNDTYESNYRISQYTATSPGCGDGTHTAYGNDTAGGGGGTPSYPVAWLRLTRAGDVITAYYSNDGVTWSDGWVRDFSTSDNGPLPAKLYLGPGYCAEWGNINAANGDAARTRYYLTQHRWGPLTTPYVVSVNGSPSGFSAPVQDMTSKFVKSTLKVWLDNTLVDASALSVVGPDATGLSTITYTAPAFLNSGQLYNVKIQFNDTATPVANLITKASSFTLSYIAVPVDYAVSSVSGNKGSMMVAGDQLNSGTRPDTVSGMETELQGGVIDVDGNPVGSSVDTNLVEMVGPVNFAQSPLDAGWFNSSNTPLYPDGTMPGGVLGTQFALRFQGYLDLKAGSYRMYVNSDDGFKLSFGPNAGDVLGFTVGSFNAGRAMTLNNDPAGFDFVILKDGKYPFRLIYGQGGGDASVEWYVKDLATGTRYLINGNESAAPQTYPSATARAYVSHFLPYPGATDVIPQPKFTIQITDASTTVASSSVQLWIDNAKVTPNVSKSGSVITTTWSPASAWPFESKHTGQLIYAESSGASVTNNFNFQVKGFYVADLSPTSFWIEVEDFDYGGGKANPSKGQPDLDVDVMPYLGGAYQGDGLPTRALYDIDYHADATGPQNNPPTDLTGAGYVYRTDIPEYTDAAQTKTDYFIPFYSALSTTDPTGQRPGSPVVNVTVNYKTGWSGGKWFNYTRNVPAGIYNVFLAASYYTGDVAPADGQINSSLGIVTAGLGTKTQTVQPLGTFNAPANGTTDTLTPLKGSDGTPAVFKLPAGKVTFRWAVSSGDSDWFALVPASNVPAKVTSANVANGASVTRDTKLVWTIEDFNTTVKAGSITVSFNGASVTPVIAKNGDVTTVTYAPTLMPIGTNSYVLSFTDSANAVVNSSATFTATALGTPGQFLIESEDFNYGGGLNKAAASTMPYKGLAYQGLDAVMDVDYHDTAALTAADGWTPVYRTGAPITSGTTAPLNENGGIETVRGDGWTLTTNYKIGWTGANQWFNYTRTIPAGNYSIIAGLSHGDAPTSTTRISAAVDLVTGDITKPNQATTRLGTFDGPATGGWGVNEILPLKNGGQDVILSSDGTPKTLRFYPINGDFDYFVLVPSTEAPPIKITTATVASGTIQINWTGGGQLQSSTSVNTGWTAIPGATTGTYSEATSGQQKFYRVKGP